MNNKSLKYKLLTLLTLLAVSLPSSAVVPLTGQQLRNVCKVFMENRTAVEGQICGYYTLGFLDGSAVAGADFCVADQPLLDVMRKLADELARTQDLQHHANQPARNILSHMLEKFYPCP